MSNDIIPKDKLDVPMNEFVVECDNTETPREFITGSEEEFGLEHKDVDNLSEEELNKWIDFLSYLWEK